MIQLKYVSLIALMVQTTTVILVTRISRQSTRVPYLNTSVVVISELFKLLSCLIILLIQSKSIKVVLASLKNCTISNLKDFSLIGIPAALYTFQNNLLFIGMSNLPGAVYQVSYQLKILVTAFLSSIILGKSLSNRQWSALLLLFVGVIFIQAKPSAFIFDGPSDVTNILSSTSAIGLGAVLIACFTSGLAGVWFEKMLKSSSSVSIWERNIQLALYGVVVGVVTAYYIDGEKISHEGFLQGFDEWTWAVVTAQAIGGLIVAAVLKYADNVLKCFGNAASICITCLLSWGWLNEFELTSMFITGTAFVVYATWIYLIPASPKKI